MPDYQKLYLLMFNAATDAIDLLDMDCASTAREILITAQKTAEEIYICGKMEECLREKRK